ncbi:MAG: MFS transporter, partial [Microbacterium sp.]
AAAYAADVAARVETLPHLDDPEQIAEPLHRTQPRAVSNHARTPAAPGRRAEVFDTLPEDEGPLTLAAAINRALADVLAADPGAIIFGEDVGRKGGVYGVTRGLQKRLGASRVFDTILDEQTILGLALGAGLTGLLPLPEIQYLAYLHNAEDQLRGEAATQAFFSEGRFTNPMVVRIAGYGYQKGFGGHFHNDNSVAVLRDIPGIVIASPGTPADAARMLRTCVATARVDGAVCVFLEPIARYHTRELLGGDDTGYMEPYPAPDGPDAHVPIGEGAVYGDGTDLTIATWANGLYLSRRAASRLEAEGIGVRIVDLRWLAPMPIDLVTEQAAATGRLLVVDETRHSGGVGEAIVSGVVAGGFRGEIARIAGHDTFTPLGPAAAHVLVSEDGIVEAARRLVRG